MNLQQYNKKIKEVCEELNKDNYKEEYEYLDQLESMTVGDLSMSDSCSIIADTENNKVLISEINIEEYIPSTEYMTASWAIFFAIREYTFEYAEENNLIKLAK